MRVSTGIAIITQLLAIQRVCFVMKRTIILLFLTTLSIQVARSQTYDTCSYLKRWAYIKPQNNFEAQEQYDTLRLFIERCAVSDSDSWEAFSPITGAVARMSNDSTRYDSYRAWLISVLYLNRTVPEYFCACLGSIADSYQYGKYHPLGYLAVNDYIRKFHPECWGAGGDAAFSRDSAYDAKHGYDASHLPSLDSMGLGFLLDHNSVAPSTPLSSQYLASFTGSPNPFTRNTTLSFELNRLAYVSVEVFDVLGRKVWGDDHGRTIDPGPHTIRIDGSTLPTGTLYARISTGFGEVRTVKLVHEQ